MEMYLLVDFEIEAECHCCCRELCNNRCNNVVPIPGSKNKERIIENLNAADVELTDEEFRALDSELDKHKVYSHRGLGGF